MKPYRFDIIHATNRPLGWQAVYAQYLRTADNPELFRYTLVIDKEQLPVFNEIATAFAERPRCQVALNMGSPCYVEAANRGCQVTEAPIILLATDDMFPTDHWDTLIWETLCAESNKHVLFVNDQAFPQIMTMQIFTRTWYDRYGYAFKPEYGSMCGDVDFTNRALRDDVVIDVRNRKELWFTHYHHRQGTRPLDASDAVNQSAERYAQGWAQMKKDWPEKATQELIDALFDAACATPSDINEHLSTLKSLVAGKNVLELGVRTGNSTTAFLAGRPKSLTSVDVDWTRLDPQIEAGAMLAGVPWTKIQGDSREPRGKFDVVFFDTIHTAAHLAAEIEAHVTDETEILIFHDTKINWDKGEDGGPGLRKPISNLYMNTGRWNEYSFDNNNGLTCMVRNDVALQMSIEGRELQEVCV